MNEKDLADLRYAKSLLENPGLIARLSNVVGTPIEKALAVLPEKASEIIHNATRKALETALQFALQNLLV